MEFRERVETIYGWYTMPVLAATTEVPPVESPCSVLFFPAVSENISPDIQGAIHQRDDVAFTSHRIKATKGTTQL